MIAKIERTRLGKGPAKRLELELGYVQNATTNSSGVTSLTVIMQKTGCVTMWKHAARLVPRVVLAGGGIAFHAEQISAGIVMACLKAGNRPATMTGWADLARRQSMLLVHLHHDHHHRCPRHRRRRIRIRKSTLASRVTIAMLAQ